jgi:hypothetical protein
MFRDPRHRSLRSNSVTNKSFQIDILRNGKRSPPPLRGAIISSLNESTPEEVTVSTLRLDHHSDLVVLPPDRPPKPAHLVHFQPASKTTAAPPAGSFENYANSSDLQAIYGSEANNNNNNINNSVNNNVNNNNNVNGSKSVRSQEVYLAPSVSRELKPGTIKIPFIVNGKLNLQKIKHFILF